MSPRTATLLLVLGAIGCEYLEEQRDADEYVTWSGYVLVDDGTSEAGTLDTGMLLVMDESGEELGDSPIEDSDGVAEPFGVGEQPYESYPGYWSVVVPLQTEVTVRLQGEGVYPTVWRGVTPSTGSASWLYGGLFARDAAWVDEFFTALSVSFPSIQPEDLSEDHVAHLWGQPWDPDAWEGATIEVSDGVGEPLPVLKLAAEEDGTLVESDGGPVDYFLAFNLEPGLVTLTVTTADGLTVQTTYPAEGGDLVSPVYYALPTTVP